MKRRKLIGAFTLIEMLTVIAIITILAGLLIPTVIGAMRDARLKVMKGMMSSLQLAIQLYYDDWNAYPPDSMEPNPGSMSLDNDTHPSTPAECLAFYLCTTFTPRSDVGNVQKGVTPGLTPGGRETYATKSGGPYYEGDQKFLKVFRTVDWPALIDAWDQPLLYNAPGGLYGDPLHNTNSYDLFSFGVNGKSKLATISIRPACTPPAWVDADWDTIMTDDKCGNDVNPNEGGNRYSPADEYVEEEADDINNW